MKEERAQKAVKRRDFLKQASLVAGTAGAAVVIASPKEALATEAEATARGYRETEHVLTYYELAKL